MSENDLPEQERFSFEPDDAPDIARFKDIARAVCYRTKGVYLSDASIRPTANGAALMCDCWKGDEGSPIEWLSWASLDRVYLRELDTETLTAMLMESIFNEPEGGLIADE